MHRSCLVWTLRRFTDPKWTVSFSALCRKCMCWRETNFCASLHTTCFRKLVKCTLFKLMFYLNSWCHYMFRTSCVHHQEDSLYMQFLYGMFFMHLYRVSHSLPNWLAGGPLLRFATIRRTTDTFLFISHTTNVLLFKFRCSIFIGVRTIKEMPGSVASGTHCTSILWSSWWCKHGVRSM